MNGSVLFKLMFIHNNVLVALLKYNATKTLYE